MTATADTRRFHVHARHVDAHHGRILEEASFEAAAVAYVEDLSDVPAQGDISLIVRELESGREHCFTVDLGDGEIEPCA